MAVFNVKTNQNPGSVSDHTIHAMPARAFFFIVVEEPGKNGLLVRKIYASPRSPYLEKMNLSAAQIDREIFPEKYGLSPKEPGSGVSVAEHVMGNNKSSYISTSSIFPEGSPRFDGKTIYIDINKALQSGAKTISTDEILQALEEYKKLHPHLEKRTNKIANYVEQFDKEVLVQSEKIPAAAVYTPESFAVAKNIARGARVVQVVGIVFTAYDLEQATEQSFKAKSVKPIVAETIRQAGGWGAAMAGFKIGAVAGAGLGIETGPGAVVTGAVGGIIFGTAGYFGADWVADHIYEN